MQTLQLRTSSTDPLGRYYTCDTVGRALVREMNLKSPKVILDLGVGNGALSTEAAMLWERAQYVTVDIDGNIKKNNCIPNNSHYTYDALNSQLHSQIGLDLGSVDGAICNPPYIRPRWRKDFSVILEDAGLSGVLPSINDVGADILFIAQNLRFLRSSGRLGLILPDGVIAGEKYTQLRKTLLTQHRIERVIELPRRVFRKTDAKAHILILTKKEKSDEPITIQRMGLDGSLSVSIHLPISTAHRRLDYSYWENQNSCGSSPKFLLGEVCEVLIRGKLSSVDVRNSLVKIFHSKDFPLILGNSCPEVPKTFLISKSQSARLNTAIAQAGDILLCRVGRNLERKICYVTKGNVALSDCVYKLHVEKQFRQEVMNYLCGNAGRNQLSALAHGVGAQYLSKADLLNLTIESYWSNLSI